MTDEKKGVIYFWEEIFMRRFFCFFVAIFFFAVAEDLNAQNLVPNPDFETHSACPNGDLSAGTIVLAPPWNRPTDGTADYYHTCSFGAFGAWSGVPANIFGNQAPHSGNAYAGFYQYIGQQNVREYIQAPLLSPLVAGQSYKVSFYVSLADTSKWAIDGIGAHFSNAPVGIYGTGANPWHFVLPLVPQVSNPTGNVISDKTNWTLVQGTFCASGGEGHIVIGNFKDDATTIVTNMTGTENAAYYYIDDVSVEVTQPNICSSSLGTLKVCKVAGPSVTVGTPFTFQAGTSTPFTVLAGPAPDGTCSIGPTFNVGSTIAVTETVPSGMIVSGITVTPPPRLAGAPNLAGGTVQVTIGSGVTEVTFTNRKQTGFLEICKQVEPRSPGGSYTFFVNPGNLGPFVVPAQGCTPAIEVAAGMVTIAEVLSPGVQMTGCSTLPPTQQGLCDFPTGTSTVNVAPGDVSTQTIAIFSNRFIPIEHTGDAHFPD
jgi:hypothetical protein